MIAALLLPGCNHREIPSSPQKALEQFYAATDVAEDQLMDPLILRGPDVVPLLIREVPSRKMPRRLYGILAIGHIGDGRGLDVLKQIVSDPSEKEDIRYGALRSITLIDRDLALEVAKGYSDQEIPGLSRLQHELESGRPLERRTFEQALRGEHWP